MHVKNVNFLLNQRLDKQLKINVFILMVSITRQEKNNNAVYPLISNFSTCLIFNLLSFYKKAQI
ncbi:hypothetical protein BKI52_42190 [marine bacterium AO1-C]|nr:hypothetical protein BKI52_42190 [marine bacterium AO1-C]